MTWFKVDDGLYGHPKAMSAGLEAMGLWTLCGSYCGRYLTDGFVPATYVRSLGERTRLAHRLVAAGLWYEDEKDGQKGWSFHKWEHYQPTRADVEADRKAARTRQAKHRESQRDRRVTDDVTNTVTHASPRGPARAGPVPSRPNSNYRSQSSDRSSARATDRLSDQDIDKIAARLHVSRSWAQQVAADILARADTNTGVVVKPAAYVHKAIDADPDRYKPSTSGLHPPKLHDAGECAKHPGELAANCRACAADAKAAG
jgi:hypothetical protein